MLLRKQKMYQENFGKKKEGKEMNEQKKAIFLKFFSLGKGNKVENVP